MTVTAKDWEDAKSVLAGVGIDEKSKVNYRTVDGLFIVSVKKEPSLSDDDYRAMREDPNVSILSDSESRQRITEVLDKVYDVETQLRKLLLHVSDLVETYFDILNNKYTKGYVDQRAISISGKLDPITSHLTLGQMKDILGYDLSWKKRQLAAQDVADLLNEADSFEDLKRKLNEKMQEKTIWSVIATNVLRTKDGWTDVNGDLNKLKEFRDQSAHYQVITDEMKIKLIEKANHLLLAITPPERKLTKREERNLSSIAETLAKIAKQVQPITIQTDYYQKLLERSVPTIDAFRVNTSALEAISKAIQPSIKASEMLQKYQSSLFDSHRSTWILDDERDNTGSEDTSSDDDNQNPNTVIGT